MYSKKFYKVIIGKYYASNLFAGVSNKTGHLGSSINTVDFYHRGIWSNSSQKWSCCGEVNSESVGCERTTPLANSVQATSPSSSTNSSQTAIAQTPSSAQQIAPAALLATNNTFRQSGRNLATNNNGGTNSSPNTNGFPTKILNSVNGSLLVDSPSNSSSSSPSAKATPTRDLGRENEAGTDNNKNINNSVCVLNHSTPSTLISNGFMSK